MPREQFSFTTHMQDTVHTLRLLDTYRKIEKSNAEILVEQIKRLSHSRLWTVAHDVAVDPERTGSSVQTHTISTIKWTDSWEDIEVFLRQRDELLSQAFVLYKRYRKDAVILTSALFKKTFLRLKDNYSASTIGSEMNLQLRILHEKIATQDLGEFPSFVQEDLQDPRVCTAMIEETQQDIHTVETNIVWKAFRIKDTEAEPVTTESVHSKIRVSPEQFSTYNRRLFDDPEDLPMQLQCPAIHHANDLAMVVAERVSAYHEKKRQKTSRRL